jgi:hypothetical protein
MVAGITALDIIAAQGVSGRRRDRRGTARRKFTDRSGFPQGIQKARGAARDPGKGRRGTAAE